MIHKSALGLTPPNKGWPRGHNLTKTKPPNATGCAGLMEPLELEP